MTTQASKWARKARKETKAIGFRNLGHPSHKPVRDRHYAAREVVGREGENDGQCYFTKRFLDD